jgi:hypothetical protein
MPGEPTIRLIVNGSGGIKRQSDSDRLIGAESHPVVYRDQVTPNDEAQSMQRCLGPDTEPSLSFVDGCGRVPVAQGYRCGLDLAEVPGGGLGRRLLRCVAYLDRC